MTEWRKVFSTGRNDGGPMILPAPAPVTLPAPPTNYFTAPIEQLHRASNPQPPFDLAYVDPFWKPDEQAEAGEPSIAKTTGEELPPVIEPAARDLASEVAQVCKPVVDYLAAYVVIEQPNADFERGYHNPFDTSSPASPESSPEAEGFEARKVDLAARFRTWSESLVEFLTAHRDWTVAELREQHAEAWQQARDEAAIVAGLLAEHNQASGDLRNSKMALSKARVAFQGHEAAKPDLDQLPSQADLDAWQADGLRLKAAWETADQAVAAALSQIQSLRLRHERERTKLLGLRKAEADLRARLSGQKMTAVGLEQEAEL
ncbi:MAG: hypothetical protein LAO30_23430 [Acidobacteriia bacterium]|nr:hypothetical protein [Terriglobia bacterium]